MPTATKTAAFVSVSFWAAAAGIQKEKLREKDDNECPEKNLSIPGKAVRFSKSHRNVPLPEIKL